MNRPLNLADIQGNILRPYGQLGFPRARYLFLHIANPAAGRAFILGVLPRITSALSWKDKPDYPGERRVTKPEIAVNLAFNYRGLQALALPTETLRAMPTEFIDGMAARGHILGDRPAQVVPAAGEWAIPAKWDPIWRDSSGDRQVHVLLSLNAAADAAPAALDSACDWIVSLCQASGRGITLLPGHGPSDALFQEAAILLQRDAQGRPLPTRQEHFGFADGFSDPVFAGQYSPAKINQAAIGSGKLLPDQTWAPLATGEFLLGYPDEAQETPADDYPFEFFRNGTFLAYRKLHENVASFKGYVAQATKAYAPMMGIAATPQGQEEAERTVMAKMAGRWWNGAPLMKAATYAEALAYEERLSAATASKDTATLAQIDSEFLDFTYHSDSTGAVCPITSHTRRANPRDGLDPTGDLPGPKNRNGSALNNRRRILRRGLPYGSSDPAKPDDAGEHGIIFMAVCASLFRQFEFVQQQWMQYGFDFSVGNDTCPLLGNHGPGAKFVIPAAAGGGKPPFICPNLPQFVEVRGGDYFFVPSLTALHMLGMGTVDPT